MNSSSHSTLSIQQTEELEQSLPTEEFFSILVDEARNKIGRNVLGRIGSLRSIYSDEDMISESLMRFWNRIMRSSIHGVAELSSDTSNVSFSEWKRVWSWLRRATSRRIADMQRRHRSEFKLRDPAYRLSRLLRCEPSILAQIQKQPLTIWQSVIGRVLTAEQLLIFTQQLAGYKLTEISIKTGTNRSKVSRVASQTIVLLRGRFDSPDLLLEAMKSAEQQQP